MTKKKQGMDEDALGGLFDSIDLVYEDDLPEAQAEESQAQATDAAPAVPVAVAEEVAEGTKRRPKKRPAKPPKRRPRRRKTPRLRMKRTKRPGKLRRGRGSIPSAPP